MRVVGSSDRFAVRDLTPVDRRRRVASGPGAASGARGAPPRRSHPRSTAEAGRPPWRIDRSGARTRAKRKANPSSATASTITNWLLVEHPSPWGAEPLRQARLPAGLGDVLLRRERELKIRVLLIRRHGRRTGPTRACFAIHTGPDRPWIERVDLEDVRDVATLDLEGLGRGGSVGLTATDGPLFAVCTHGRRDPCCAERGRPLASALSQAFPDETWESTHIGGDRFAGNMIAFPHGFYFGRVGPAQGAEIATAYVAGTLDLEHLRGRACRPIGRAGGRAVPAGARCADRHRRRHGRRRLPRGPADVDDVPDAARAAEGRDPSRPRATRSGSRVTASRRSGLHGSRC